MLRPLPAGAFVCARFRGGRSVECAILAGLTATFGAVGRSRYRASNRSPRLYDHHGADHPLPRCGTRTDRRGPGVGGHPLPQRGGEHRGVRRRGAQGDRGRRHHRRGRRGRQRLRGSQRRAGPGLRRPRGHRAASRLRLRVPGRLRRRPRPIHRDGRRRPHLRLRRDPQLRPRAGRRRRPRHGRPDGQHPARRDAVAAPVRGQPAAVGVPEPALQDRRARRPLRHARDPPRQARGARPAHPGDGVRLRDGHPGRQGAPGHPRVPHRLPPARRRVEALDLSGRLAAPALPAGAQPHAPLHHPRRDPVAPRRDRDARLAQRGGAVRPLVAAAHHDRRLAAAHRRRPGADPRPVRPRLRHVLHA